MTCCVCMRGESRAGALCEDCRDALIGPVAITHEQIREVTGFGTSAALVDVWGGTHRLCADTTIGRSIDPGIMSVFDCSVSRRHARIALGDEGWTTQDLGSANGTFVDDGPVTGPRSIVTGSRIRIGAIAFYFVADVSGLSAPSSLDEVPQTLRPSRPISLERTEPIRSKQMLRDVRVQLFEPSGGGGGVIEIDGARAQLTLAQYELMSRLVARMIDSEGQPEESRGFVSSTELAGVLSLDALRPGEDNVRQLVRRVRRALLRAGIGDLIESRYGFGYRLIVLPRA